PVVEARRLAAHRCRVLDECIAIDRPEQAGALEVGRNHLRDVVGELRIRRRAAEERRHRDRHRVDLALRDRRQAPLPARPTAAPPRGPPPRFPRLVTEVRLPAPFIPDPRIDCSPSPPTASPHPRHLWPRASWARATSHGESRIINLRTPTCGFMTPSRPRP